MAEHTVVSQADAPPSALQVVRPAAGGMRGHVATLASGLVARGYRVSIASPTPFLVPGCPDVRADIPARTSLLRDWAAIRQVAGALRQGVSVAHGHGLRGAFVAAIAARSAGVPLVFTAHNLAPPAAGVLARHAVRMVLRRSRVVICVSHAVAESLKPFGLDRDRMAVVPNGIHPVAPAADIDRAATLRAHGLEWKDGASVVLAVGRLAPEKGFDVLLQAVAELRASGAAVAAVIAGEGPEGPLLTALRTALGLESAVAMPGYVADVGPLLSACDVVAVPSRAEGQSLLALEAMSAGRPVVATSVGGLVETLDGGRLGVLVPPDDVRALGGALAEMLRNSARRRAYGEAARDFVSRERSVDRMLDGVASAYGRALSDSVR